MPEDIEKLIVSIDAQAEAACSAVTELARAISQAIQVVAENPDVDTALVFTRLEGMAAVAGGAVRAVADYAALNMPPVEGAPKARVRLGTLPRGAAERAEAALTPYREDGTP